MICDATNCILELAAVSGTVARIRREAGEYVKGRWVEGAPSTTIIRAHVQPVTGKDLEMLPEAFRQRETVKIWSLDDIRTGSKETGTSPDTIVWKNRFYEVHGGVKDWSNEAGYYEAICIAESVNQ